MQERLTCGHPLRVWIHVDSDIGVKHYMQFCPRCREYAAYSLPVQEEAGD